MKGFKYYKLAINFRND